MSLEIQKIVKIWKKDLKELKWKGDIIMSKPILISSKYFDIGIQTLPNIAVHHLKNIEFLDTFYQSFFCKFIVKYLKSIIMTKKGNIYEIYIYIHLYVS